MLVYPPTRAIMRLLPSCMSLFLLDVDYVVGNRIVTIDIGRRRTQQERAFNNVWKVNLFRFTKRILIRRVGTLLHIVWIGY